MKFNKFFIFGSLFFGTIFLSSVSLKNSLNLNLTKTNVLSLETIDISKLNLDDFGYQVNLKDLSLHDQELTELNLDLIDKLWEKVWKQTFSKATENTLINQLQSKINNSQIVLKNDSLILGHIYLDSALTKKAVNKDIIVGRTVYIKLICQRNLSGTLVLKIDLI